MNIYSIIRSRMEICSYYSMKVFLTILFTFSVSLAIQAAESVEFISKSDIEAPNIKHNIENDIYNTSKSDIHIQATVTDDIKLKSVVVYFRGEKNKNYRKRLMHGNDNQQSTYYSTDIPRKEFSESLIEYYIEANDTSGNRKLVGMSFSPLKRDLETLGKGKANIGKVKSNTLNRETPNSSLDYALDWVPGF